jgi:hypothetical protein
MDKILNDGPHSQPSISNQINQPKREREREMIPLTIPTKKLGLQVFSPIIDKLPKFSVKSQRRIPGIFVFLHFITGFIKI